MYKLKLFKIWKKMGKNKKYNKNRNRDRDRNRNREIKDILIKLGKDIGINCYDVYVWLFFKIFYII